ncbi:MAG: hypothetical protein L0Z68_10350 [Gammaproteobacteria bacterium]|nr:hypothetical protein [Gammaproteobacteria bacterium]
MNDATIMKCRETTLKRLKLQREIAKQSEKYYQTAEELALQIPAALKTSQIRNLENVAHTTGKVSDILDLVKKQIGRDKGWSGWGEELLNSLGACRAEGRRIAERIARDEEDLPRQASLMLCRELIKHLAAHFLYQRKKEDE